MKPVSLMRRRARGPRSSGLSRITIVGAVAGVVLVLLAASAAAQDDSITETVKLPGKASSKPKIASAGPIPASKRLPHALGREHTAGQELFLLASNFLLYTALVIVAIMISKLYLEADVSASPSTRERLNTPHDVIELLTGGRGASSRQQLPRSKPSLLDFQYYETGGSTDGLRSKAEVLRSLGFCSIGLITSFLIWGILQERMLTMPYRDGEMFTYSYGLVFTNRLFSLILSALLVFAFERDSLQLSSAPLYEYSFPSVSNMLSSWCQYEALSYVTFPTQTLSKSFKLVPIMLMGKLLTDKNYPLYEYAVAASIGLGNTLFMMATEHLDLGVDSFGQVEDLSGTWCGVMLLLLFLFFDSFTTQWQSRMFSKHAISPVIMMFYLNAFSTVFSLITLVHTRELTPFFEFIMRHPSIHLHFWLFSICSTIGQLFIFYTIKIFGPVVFAIIMSTRILLSIAVSCFLYDHPIPPLGYAGLVIVFLSIGYRIKRKTQGQRLLQWAGMDDSQGPTLIKEWHEHLDI